MKPTSKLHIPINEKASSFFSSPYPPHQPSSSQLSPIPDSSPSSAAFTNSRSPLLPPSPKVLESGYPFPATAHANAGGRWARVRMALRQSVVPQGMLRRALMLFLALGLTVLVLHRSGTSVCCISLSRIPYFLVEEFLCAIIRFDSRKRTTLILLLTSLTYL